MTICSDCDTEIEPGENMHFYSSFGPDGDVLCDDCHEARQNGEEDVNA